MLHQNVLECRGFRLLDQAELEFISGGADDEIVVTAPTPEWNSDLNSYAVLGSDGGYVTYDYVGGFLGLFGGDYVVSGGGTYDINGGGWEIGTGGVSYSQPTYTYSADSDSDPSTSN